ncbi:Hypothetical predicted protein [Lecanosticta acicola]|uniref:Uncharacterized protein n=1 Tax=Lecanosticta acicola TaxID=111012 RepID=A0AAI8YT42_9PEZI|nr:Hypothetical predicted protein [Lecanosticta acicola]
MPDTVRATCPPESGARTADGSPTRIATDLNTGFVSNYEHSKSPCHQPELLQLHGTFFAPWCERVTVNPVPVFSAQKVGGGSGNVELRVPSTIYWSEPWAYYSASKTDDDWSLKSDVVFWRGANSGGKINESNWRGFHRHRFVAMMDADNILEIEESGESSVSWAMPESMLQFLRKHGDCHMLSEFVGKHLDVGFYAFSCEDGSILDEAEHDPDSCMGQLEATFRLLDWVPPSQV